MREHLRTDSRPEPPVGAAQPLPGGAALVAEGQAWLLADDRPEHFLGPALAWAAQAGAAVVHLLAARATGLLARRAGYFRDPARVWRVDGRSLAPAPAEPLPPPVPLDPRLVPLMDVISAGGAEVVEEHGTLTGAVLGLEVCRAVVDPASGTPRLEVGVGPYDREAFRLLHGDVPPVEALIDLVAEVRALRRPGGPPHPLRRMAGARLLRAELLDDPSRLGLVELVAAPPPVAGENVNDRAPCVARGHDPHGRPVIAVCSVGVDLDLVPFAADARAAQADPDVRLVLAVPRRDAHPVTRALLERLVEPGELVGV